MAEVRPSDILFRAGGKVLLRYGVPAITGGGRPRTGDLVETFTRADATTCATSIDRDGIARLAAANVPRVEWVDLDGDGIRETPGLLLEGSRKNIAHFTRDLTNAFWTKESTDTVTADAGQAADGSVTADKIVEAAASSLHGCNHPFAFAAGDSLCWSAVVEAAGRNVFQMMVRSDAEVNGFRGQFDASTGAYTPQTAQGTGTLIGGGMIKLRTGKYRAWLSGKVDSLAVSALARLNYNNPAGTITYLGDGASGMIISDTQFEVGAFPSSIIPALAGVDVTRAADALTLLFNVGPIDLTVLARMGRPAYADAVGALGPTRLAVIQMGAQAGNHIELFANGASRQWTSRFSDGVANSQDAAAAIPAGAEQRFIGQFKAMTTNPLNAIDVGSGLSAFTDGAVAGFVTFGSQTLRLGSTDNAGQELYGVLFDLIPARGVRTFAEMLAIP